MFEEVVYSEPIAGVDTPMHMRDGNLLYGSASTVGSSEEGAVETMNYFSLLGCPHGTQVSFDTLVSGAKVNYGCTPCQTATSEDGEDEPRQLYSTGFSGCQSCAYWLQETTTSLSPYKKSVIDVECEPEPEPEVPEEPEEPDTTTDPTEGSTTGDDDVTEGEEGEDTDESGETTET